MKNWYGFSFYYKVHYASNLTTSDFGEADLPSYWSHPYIGRYVRASIVQKVKNEKDRWGRDTYKVPSLIYIGDAGVESLRMPKIQVRGRFELYTALSNHRSPIIMAKYRSKIIADSIF